MNLISFIFLMFCKFLITDSSLWKFKRSKLTTRLEYKKIFSRGSSETNGYQFDEIRVASFYIPYNGSDENFNNYVPSILATNGQKENVKKILDSVLTEIKKIIKVRQTKGLIYFPRFCLLNGSETGQVTYCQKFENHVCAPEAYCNYLPVPFEHTSGCYYKDENNEVVYPNGEGIKDTDLMVYYSLANCSDHGDLAFAATCLTEAKFGNPISGMLIVCYNRLFAEEISVGFWRSVLLHEMLHILLLELSGEEYVDEHGNRMKDTVIQVPQKWKFKNESFVDYMAILSTLPNVVDFARKHFNCSTLKGLDLQNTSAEFSHGLYYGHVEESLFPDALLSPLMQDGTFISQLEIAFLKDTGWYKVNDLYEAAELKVTRNKGCDFVTMSCYEYMKHVQYEKIDTYPYCLPERKFDWFCSKDYTRRVQCKAEDKGENYFALDWRFNNCPYITSLDHKNAICFYNNSFYGIQPKLCVWQKLAKDETKYDNYILCENFHCKRDTLEINFGYFNVTSCNAADIGKFIPVTGRSNLNDQIQCPDFADLCKKKEKEEKRVSTSSSNSDVYATGNCLEMKKWISLILVFSLWK